MLIIGETELMRYMGATLWAVFCYGSKVYKIKIYYKQ